MLRVQCEQCKAPYQVDERRVPAGGLKMRCPKCSHTFVVRVEAGASDAEPASAQVRTAAEAGGPPSEKMRAMKQTMIGFGTGGAITPMRRPASTLMAFGSSGSLDTKEVAAKLGEAPKKPPLPVGRPPKIAPQEPAPSIEPFEFDDPLEGGDLPAVAGDLPEVLGRSPSPKLGGAPAPKLPPGKIELPPIGPAVTKPELPAVGRPAVPKPAVTKPELPAARGGALGAAKPELPAVRGGGVLGAAKPASPAPNKPAVTAADLPARSAAPKPDLPAVRAGGIGALGNPPPMRPKAASGTEIRTASSDMLDLPLVRAEAALPESKPRPEPAPEPRARTSRDSTPDGSSSLPAVLGGAPLELDADLPLVQNALPALQGMLPDRLDAADLPLVQNALPAVQDALPTRRDPFADAGPSGSGAASNQDFGMRELEDSAALFLDLENAPNPASPASPAPSTDPFEEAANAFGGFGDPPASDPPGGVSGSATGGDAFGEFGELELPPAPPPIEAAPYVPPPSYGDDLELSSTLITPREEIRLEMGGKGEAAAPPLASVSVAPEPPPPSVDRRFGSREAGGMAFGELDFGSDTEVTTGALPRSPGSLFPSNAAAPPGEASHRSASLRPFEGFDMPTEAGVGGVAEGGGLAAGIPTASIAPAPPEPARAFEAAIPTEVAQSRLSASSKRRSRAPRVVFGVVVVAALAGGGLELSPYGAFGRHVISDRLHASEYERALGDAAKALRDQTASDLFSDSVAALDKLSATQRATPRARPLKAYAALAELGAQLRFGNDADRAARARQSLSELPPQEENAYASAARAVEDALSGDLDKGRRGLESLSARLAGDPMEEDVFHARGEIELRAHNGPAALDAFTRASSKRASARAHYGVARAHTTLGDFDAAQKAMDKVFASSPNHVGALLLRATFAWDRERDEAKAMADLAKILDGQPKEGGARGDASPREVAGALALRGFIHAARGRAGEARVSFEKALQIESREVRALLGQGEVFFHEGRYTEALTRFETAVQTDPGNVDAILGAAKTKIKLERLADAKTQLVDARAKHPKEPRIAYYLGRVAEAQGDKVTAEHEYVSAIEHIDVRDSEAVLPYVGLATLMASQGRTKDAEAKLAEARAKLPDSAVMQRALGEVAASRGAFDEAVTHFQSAITKDPLDLSTRFKLAVTLRRMRKLDEARKEFDKIVATDKDYPGLALERGLLYEDSGDVPHALEQFQSALAKAPDDPDLQLRVGAAYTAIDRAAEAVPILKKVLEARANSAEANHYLGRAMFLQGGAKETEAMRYLKRAVELDPNRAEYHLYVAWAANESASPQLGLARDHVDKALAIDNLMADAYWQRGVLERKLGSVDDAVKDLKYALSLKPSRIEAYAALAECYEVKNDVAAAMAAWQKAIAQKSNQPYWRYRFGRLLVDRNRAGEAAKHLQYAVAEADKAEPQPAWLPTAEFAYAQALHRSGKKAEAVTHYRRFLELAPKSSPDRRDATHALAALGAPIKP